MVVEGEEGMDSLVAGLDWCCVCSMILPSIESCHDKGF